MFVGWAFSSPPQRLKPLWAPGAAQALAATVGPMAEVEARGCGGSWPLPAAGCAAAAGVVAWVLVSTRRRRAGGGFCSSYCRCLGSCG